MSYAQVGRSEAVMSDASSVLYNDPTPRKKNNIFDGATPLKSGGSTFKKVHASSYNVNDYFAPRELFTMPQRVTSSHVQQDAHQNFSKE